MPETTPQPGDIWRNRKTRWTVSIVSARSREPAEVRFVANNGRLYRSALASFLKRYECSLRADA